MSKAGRKLYYRITGGIVKAAGQGLAQVQSDDLMMLCETRVALRKYLRRRRAQAGQIDELILLASSLVSQRPPPAAVPARLRQMKVNGHDMDIATANRVIPSWHPEGSS